MPEENTTQQPSAINVQRPTPSLKSSLGVPIAIVLAALIIGAAIIYTGSTKGRDGTQVANARPGQEQKTKDTDVAPVTDKDHIRGNPNAPIVIVEYSDFDCPFCKQFHATMQQIMSTYGKDGKVAWVYRQFPLQQLHPNAVKIASASECVSHLGGNDAFWKFADTLIGERAINEQTNISKLPEYAERAGIDKTRFNDCYAAGTYNDLINKSVEAALKAGAEGTPYSVIIAGDQKGIINGAQPYANVKQIIDTILGQLEGKSN